MSSILRRGLLKANEVGIFTKEQINAIEDCVVFHKKDIPFDSETYVQIDNLTKEPS